MELSHTDPLYSGLGLTWLPDSPNSISDTLYASGGLGDQNTEMDLGTVDPATMKVTPVAKTDSGGKLTSTGDGRLFGIGGSFTFEFDPSTAALVAGPSLMKLPFVSWPGVAFAFWGGSLWVFMADSSDPDSSTTVIFQLDINTLVGTQVATIPAYVTGAGVSPCAPIEPPN